MAAIFACIVQPKIIEFNVNDQKLHRAQKDEELRAELEALSLTRVSIPIPGAKQPVAADVEGLVLCQPGGGCRVLSLDSSVSVASVGSAVCVFEGSLTNSVALAVDFAPVPEDEPIAAAPALSGAELMCHMYAKVGVEMLELLRGSFTFVLYESKTSRVLAARDGSGRCPLFQARTAAGSLVLSNCGELLAGGGCHDTLEFLPGDYKYGWSATPRRYQPADHAKLSRRSLDLSGSTPPHHGPHGHQGSQPGSRNGSRRASLDQHDFPAGALAIPAGGGGKPRRTSNDHHGSPNCGGLAFGSPGHQPQQPPLQPHRTYIVSAEDPRIVKASAARQHQAAAPTVTAATAADGQHGKAGDRPGRGGSAKQSSSGHHNRRRSMDNPAALHLGSVQGGAAAAKAGGTPAEQQHQSTTKQQGQKQHGGAGGGGGGKQGAPNGAAKVRSGNSRDGRPCPDGRTPTKSQQQQGQQHAPASGTPTGPIAAAAAAEASAALRVDAPEFKPHWTVAAGAAAAPVPLAVAVATSS